MRAVAAAAINCSGVSTAAAAGLGVLRRDLGVGGVSVFMALELGRWPKGNKAYSYAKRPSAEQGGR